MRELPLSTTSATALAIQKVVTDSGYRVHDLFHSPQNRCVTLVVDLKTVKALPKKNLDTFVANLLESVPVIQDISLDFIMTKKTGGFPSFILNISEWN